MERRGDDMTSSLELLATMKRSLALHESHRENILDLLARGVGQPYTLRQSPRMARDQRRVFVTVKLGLVVVSLFLIAAVVGLGAGTRVTMTP